MSSPQQLYHQFHKRLKGLEKWGRPELVQTLAYLMVGIFQSQDVRLSRIASNVPLGRQDESIAQRFRRWLKHPRVNARTIYDPVVVELLGSLCHTRLRIQIDRTVVDDRFNVLMLGLYHRKRALPLVWQVLEHEGSGGWLEWRAVLSHLADLLPEEAAVLLLGDQEFGQAATIRLLRDYGWDFCLRVKGNYQVSSQWGLWLALSELAPAPGQQRFYPICTLPPVSVFRQYILPWLVMSSPMILGLLPVICPLHLVPCEIMPATLLVRNFFPTLKPAVSSWKILNSNTQIVFRAYSLPLSCSICGSSPWHVKCGFCA